MAKIIKKKSGWLKHIMPKLRMPPCKPQKTIENIEKIRELYTMGNYGELNLGLLLDRLPPGSNLHDVIVSSNASRDYADDDIDVKVCFFLREMKTIENPHYEKHMKDYEKYYAKWLIEKDKHENVLKEWKAWVKQEDEYDRLLKIAKAKKLLENNGMKVI